MTKQEQIRLIEAYKEGRLEGIELARFERLLEKDPQLKKALKLEDELEDVFREDSDYNLFKALVKEAEHQYFNEAPQQQNRWWRVAAAVFLMAGVLAIFLLIQDQHGPEELFSAHFEPYAAPSQFRNTDLVNIDEDFLAGMVRYDQGDYLQAIPLFKQVLARDSLNYTAQMLLGISHLAQKDFLKAEVVLKTMSQNEGHLFADPVNWYLGLLYLTDPLPENDGLAKGYFDQVKTEIFREKIKALGR